MKYDLKNISSYFNKRKWLFSGIPQRTRFPMVIKLTTPAFRDAFGPTQM